MQIPKHYEPRKTEDKWYKYWINNGFFHSEPDDREPYAIVIPPPNVTGALHMGHMLNNTIQDILVRRARMQGFNACWVPGTDHASIATEAKVVALLKEKGIDKSELSREEFLKHAWEWKEKHGGIILEQLKKLGASCDWNRTRFTMEEELSKAVIHVFIDLYNKGLIYRGERMVNWDPVGLTAVSDEEVIHKEEDSKFYYIRYKIVEGTGNEYITIATTRPETILGDTAICLHPDDKRYRHLEGKMALVPLINRPIPFIFDEYVDIEFGTGALKVTPAHDVNDNELGKKHKLETIDIFNNDGTLNKNAQIFIGEDRFIVREKISKQLDKEGHLEKVELLNNKVGYSERTDTVIEPKLSIQWFCNMKNLVKPALENVMNDNIKFYPSKYKNTYKYWMENVRDWCISRQLWWGHRIPAWYYGKGTDDYVVAETIEEAFQIANSKLKINNLKLEDLRQDEDVLDTWFSSWLWPISVFDGFSKKGEKDIQYYYPTDALVTAPEILFFWVARMIMAGYEYMGEKPFKNVYFTGIVRDKQHRKMSKSLGNSPEPLDLIGKYGADGVRVGMLLCSPAGNDLLFDESLCEQGRNFCNKIWNAFRLVKSWEVEDTTKQPESSKVAVNWFNAKLNLTIETINNHFSKYRISDALMATYKLIWDDFCSWYLEIIKPDYEQPIDKITFDASINFFERLLKLLHPFMPFISEELWHLIRERDAKVSIVVSDWAEAGKTDDKLIDSFNTTIEVITGIRNVRKEKNIHKKQQLSLLIKSDPHSHDTCFDSVILKLCNLSGLTYQPRQKGDKDHKIDNAVSFIVRSTEYFIPIENAVDPEDEIIKVRQELEYTKGFLRSIMKKLDNENFINNAPPQVIEKERKKQVDAEVKIKVLEEQLEG
ncbi:MAG: valine--tRNA ligase [Bacteroidota bacterium]